MFYRQRAKKSQSGVVLVISLIMLLLLTLIGVTSVQVTSLEERMAGNSKDRNLAFQSAESALTLAENSLTLMPTFVDAGTGGFYSNSTTVDLSDAELLKASFWQDNPVATSTVTGLGNGIEAPKYIIQKLDSTVCLSTCPPGNYQSVFKVTVRATGGSKNAVVVLQSHFVF